MQYVLTKSIEFHNGYKLVLVPAGVLITVDLAEMIGYFGGEHFDVKQNEISILN